ncbi:MAG TPA: 4Fe-4S dicluster domain-containing protein [Chloroflexota bacterium]|nr:4Fe-4S dicluster domain-containing protein [Chloroflexota bacterium]
MKAFAVDVSRCNGCYCCQIACKDEHVANDWTPYAKPQPDTGQFWCKLNEYVQGQVPKVKMHYVPVMCQHCDNAACIEACKVEGAVYKREDGLVVIDPEKCTGCKNCADSCAYNAIYFNEDMNIAQKCTGCAHLLDDGWKEPRCVDACPTGALKFGEEAEMAALAGQKTPLRPELDTQPRVYYYDIPKQFVGGTVYDPVQKEVVIGATVTINAAGKTMTTTTDEFGDFWFHGLDAGSRSISIEAKGFKPKTIDAINTEESVSLGDIPLEA